MKFFCFIFAVLTLLNTKPTNQCPIPGSNPITEVTSKNNDELPTNCSSAAVIRYKDKYYGLLKVDGYEEEIDGKRIGKNLLIENYVVTNIEYIENENLVVISYNKVKYNGIDKPLQVNVTFKDKAEILKLLISNLNYMIKSDKYRRDVEQVQREIGYAKDISLNSGSKKGAKIHDGFFKLEEKYNNLKQGNKGDKIREKQAKGVLKILKEIYKMLS
jgi:hypothetical protein